MINLIFKNQSYLDFIGELMVSELYFKELGVLCLQYTFVNFKNIFNYLLTQKPLELVKIEQLKNIIIIGNLVINQRNF